MAWRSSWCWRKYLCCWSRATHGCLQDIPSIPPRFHPCLTSTPTLSYCQEHKNQQRFSCRSAAAGGSCPPRVCLDHQPGVLSPWAVLRGDQAPCCGQTCGGSSKSRAKKRASKKPGDPRTTLLSPRDCTLLSASSHFLRSQSFPSTSSDSFRHHIKIKRSKGTPSHLPHLCAASRSVTGKTPSLQSRSALHQDDAEAETLPMPSQE